MTDTFIDADGWKVRKDGQHAEGDTFLFQRTGTRVCAVLSDGLGSGIKASVLSTLTATLALRCLERDLPADRTASLIMESLPVCSVRHIAYATFTLVDADSTGKVRLWEYENPPALLIRDGVSVPIERVPVAFPTGNARHQTLKRSEFHVVPGDRLVFCSDGVTQAGMGSPAFPLGWGTDRWETFMTRTLTAHPRLSARRLARLVVQEAAARDSEKPKDDISCLCLYFREPRDLLVVTGPPFDEAKDSLVVEQFKAFRGKKVVCGGTTAQLISRGLGKPLFVDLEAPSHGLPPPATMAGADLVTEGILTLGRAAVLLESHRTFETQAPSPAMELILAFLDADRIRFLVGTRVNEAHQDPQLPLELEIRRNIVKRIVDLLRDKFLKEVDLDFI
jgi:hypothetical protein